MQRVTQPPLTIGRTGARVTDLDWMDRALALAERGRGQTSPNPLVGATVVAPDGEVVGDGYHERAGTPHAEVHALAAVGTLVQHHPTEGEKIVHR